MPGSSAPGCACWSSKVSCQPGSGQPLPLCQNEHQYQALVPAKDVVTLTIPFHPSWVMLSVIQTHAAAQTLAGLPGPLVAPTGLYWHALRMSLKKQRETWPCAAAHGMQDAAPALVSSSGR